jgi:hypothetical protein
MNPNAIDSFSTVGVGVLCLVLGIMALTVFFKVIGWLETLREQPTAMTVRGVLKKGTWATVHMSGAETFKQVRVIGFTSTDATKMHLPYDLNGMVILEDRQGTRFLVRAKAIRMIVIAPEPTRGRAEGAVTPRETDEDV